MKRIKYNLFQGYEESDGTAILLESGMPWREAAEEIAKREAYNGEYEVFDDGEPEPVAEPSTGEVLDTLLGVS